MTEPEASLITAAGFTEGFLTGIFSSALVGGVIFYLQSTKAKNDHHQLVLSIFRVLKEGRDTKEGTQGGRQGVKRKI